MCRAASCIHRFDSPVLRLRFGGLLRAPQPTARVLPHWVLAVWVVEPLQNHTTYSCTWDGRPRARGDGGKGALPFDFFYYSSLSNPSSVAVTLTDGCMGC